MLAGNDDKTLTTRLLALAQEQWGRPSRNSKPQPAEIELLRAQGDPELHSIAPWWIAVSDPQTQRIAKQSLMRHGFEVYYPQAKYVTHLPQRMISSKTRHKKKVQLWERLRPVYGQYLFIRRMWGAFDPHRIFELDGVAGLCCFGAVPAFVHDYCVEILRLEVADGLHDTHFGVSAKEYHLGDKRLDKAAMEQHNFVCKLVGRLDESQRTIHFVEEFGRITRIITSVEDL